MNRLATKGTVSGMSLQSALVEFPFSPEGSHTAKVATATGVAANGT